MRPAFAFRSRIYSKTGDRPGPIFAILYRSCRHRRATWCRTDFQEMHENPIRFNDFVFDIVRSVISSCAHFTPKSTKWDRKNSGFVVLAMSPKTHPDRPLWSACFLDPRSARIWTPNRLNLDAKPAQVWTELASGSADIRRVQCRVHCRTLDWQTLANNQMQHF